ncbi:MAG: hypothetical protein HY255_01175 [Betaproteobacteria bacterium]|nr:hypothetical protein [Betaproteobacteria bacterium]
MNGFAKLLVALLVGAAGLAGLLMSLCGGFFTVVAIANGKINDSTVAISVPSLLIGGAIAWVAFWYLMRSTKKAFTPPPAQSGQDTPPPG